MYTWEIITWDSAQNDCESERTGITVRAENIAAAESAAMYDLRHQYGNTVHQRDTSKGGTVFAEYATPKSRRKFALSIIGPAE